MTYLAKTTKPERIRRLVTRTFFFVGCASISLPSAHAVPANPSVLIVNQPDKSSFKAVMRGDEYQGWMETVDGYTVVKNRAKGDRFEYATLGAKKELVPSGIPVIVAKLGATEVTAAGVHLPPKGLRPPRNSDLELAQNKWLSSLSSAREWGSLGATAMAALPSGPPSVTGIWRPHPIVGSKKLLLILVTFTDAKFTQTATYWSNVAFASNGKSVATFYRDNSHGVVTIVPVQHHQPGSPAGVVTVSLPQKNPNYGNAISCQADGAWVNKVLSSASSFVDFSSLDADNDGVIAVDEALIYFVLAGYETSAGSGQEPSVWAHRCSASNVAVAGKKVNNFALNGEMYAEGIPMQMGVIAHEMGHAMGGLPDLYDITYTNAGLGAFSVMSFGSWGARDGETAGATPVQMDAWSRQYLGWASPRVVSVQTKLSFPSGLADPTAPVLLINPKMTTSEYWLVENRAPVGWDQGLYGEIGSWKGGLLIQHIDANIGSESANTFNSYVTGGHQGNLAVQPLSAQCDLMRSSKEASCPSILFYAGNAVAFDDATTPPSRYYSGGRSSLGVIGISGPAATMSGTVELPP